MLKDESSGSLLTKLTPVASGESSSNRGRACEGAVQPVRAVAPSTKAAWTKIASERAPPSHPWRPDRRGGEWFGALTYGFSRSKGDILLYASRKLTFLFSPRRRPPTATPA